MDGARKFALGLVSVVLTLAFATWAPDITTAERLAALNLVGVELGVVVVGNVATHIAKRPARGRQTEAG